MKNEVKTLAEIIVSHSCSVKKNEKVLITYEGEECKPLVFEIIKQVYEKGGFPYTEIMDNELARAVMMGSKDPTKQFELKNKHALYQMKDMDCFVAIRGGRNASELSDVPAETLQIYSKALRETQRYRVDKTKWVILRYPSPQIAQAAGMSTEKFYNYFFSACNADYKKMGKDMKPLVNLMNKTDKVRIVSPGTDLSFSIKGMKAVPCFGERNIPDGEVYTAPVKNSVNGVITYNTVSIEQGFTFSNISFEFKDGKIVKATSNDNKRINQILDTDEGARYVGEFSLGVNPKITMPMKDTLFDEKIGGSLHFTPGAAYEDAFNGNRSAVHWDLVLIQTKKFGGGEIYFDDKLIRKDGKFVLDNLKGLN